MSAVSIARYEYLRCPPRRREGFAFHRAIASGDNQMVKLPCSTNARSESDQMPTRYFVLHFGWTRDLVLGMARYGIGEPHIGGLREHLCDSCTNATRRAASQLSPHGLTA
ncbi:MAG: hypothetical protein ACI91B_003784 [Planctomycetota bacterium]